MLTFFDTGTIFSSYFDTKRCVNYDTCERKLLYTSPHPDTIHWLIPSTYSLRRDICLRRPYFATKQQKNTFFFLVCPLFGIIAYFMCCCHPPLSALFLPSLCSFLHSFCPIYAPFLPYVHLDMLTHKNVQTNW